MISDEHHRILSDAVGSIRATQDHFDTWVCLSYKQGASSRELAEYCRMSPTRIRRILRRHRVQIRSRGNPIKGRIKEAE